MSGLLASRASWRRHLHFSYQRCLCVLLLATQALVSPLLGQEYHKLYAQGAVSTARITTPKEVGLGVAIGKGDILVTCAHVVDGATWVDVSTGLGDVKGRVIAIDEENDLALVGLPMKLVPVRINRNPDLAPRESFVMALGMRERVMDMDARPGRVITYFKENGGNYMTSQISEPGFSGGAVLDKDGFLLGIIRAKAYFQEFLTDEKTEGSEVIPGFKIYELGQRAAENLSSR